MPPHLLTAADWTSPAQTVLAAVSTLVAVVSVLIATRQHRERVRTDLELAEQRRLMEEQRQEAREQKERADRLAEAERQRRERVLRVAATWGNDPANRGDVVPADQFGALVVNDTETVVRFVHVTVTHHRNPRWTSKSSVGDLPSHSRHKWAATKVYRHAWGELPEAGMDEVDWQNTGAFSVEVTFVEDGTFWLHDRDGVHEMGSNLVIWAERTRASALGRLIAEGFTPDYGVRAQIVPFDSIEDLQYAFDAVRDGGSPPGAEVTSTGDALAAAVPDVVVAPHDWLGRAIEHNGLDRVNLTHAQSLSFDDKALDALRRGHRLYGIPYVYDSVALVRNVGLTGDGPLPATLSEVFEAGEALRAAGAVEHPLALQVGPAGDPYHLWPLFSSVGGSLFGLRDDGGFDPPEMWRADFVRAFERLGELGVAGRGVLRADIGRPEAVAMFREGRTPFLVGSSRVLVSMPSEMRVDVSTVPPLGPEPARSLVSVYGFFICRDGANKRIAQDLVTHFLARTETGERLVEIQPRPPVQVDAMRRVERDNPRLAPYIGQCRDGVLMPTHRRMREVWSTLGRAQREVIEGADPRSTGERVADEGWRLLTGSV